MALKTPDEWCAELGATVVDPDGWRGSGGRPWEDPISREEFDRRLRICTIDGRGYPEFIGRAQTAPDPALSTSADVCTTHWFRGLTVDHLYADCPNMRRAEDELRRVGWWDGDGDGWQAIDPHGADVCGMCVHRHNRSEHKGAA